MPKKSDKNKEHYVNNGDFTNAIVEYSMTVAEAKKNNKTKPIIPDYIAECFLKMAHGLSHKPNFYSYSYREEMVMDGVENCVKAIGNYDISASTRTGKPNPFGYFTQIMYFAFLRRIAKENRQQEIKEKFISHANVESFMSENSDSHYDGSSIMEKMRTRHLQY
jgi:hypothetical protein